MSNFSGCPGSVNGYNCHQTILLRWESPTGNKGHTAFRSRSEGRLLNKKVQLVLLYLQAVLNTFCTICKRKSICKMQYVTCDMCVE